MANTFKNIGVAVPATKTTIYTVPAATTAVVIQAQAANVAVDPKWCSFGWGNGTDYHLVKTLPVPELAAVGLVSGKLVLEAGDTLWVQAEATSNIELTVSILEMTT